MQIIRPRPVDEEMLTASDVPADDYPEWDSEATYSEKDRVVYGIEAWEALADDVTSEPSTAIPEGKETPDWLRLGFINRWRMFRDGRDSKTRQDGGINVTVTPGAVVNGLTLLGVEGLDVTVTMTDPAEGMVYERTESITDIGVGNWYDYYFLPYDVREVFVFTDLPPYSGASIDVSVRTITPTSTSAVGRFVVGIVRDLGFTLRGTSVRTMDFSIRERDGFGNLTIVRRRQINLVDYRVLIDCGRVDFVKRELDHLRNRETVFIGSPDLSATVVFGFYRDFNITIAGRSSSDATLEVEGY